MHSGNKSSCGYDRVGEREREEVAALVVACFIEDGLIHSALTPSRLVNINVSALHRWPFPLSHTSAGKAISNPIRGLAERSGLKQPWPSVSEELLGNYYVFLHIKDSGFCSNRAKGWENKLKLLCYRSWQWGPRMCVLLQYILCVCVLQVSKFILKWNIVISLIQFKVNVMVKCEFCYHLHDGQNIIQPLAQTLAGSCLSILCICCWVKIW